MTDLALQSIEVLGRARGAKWIHTTAYAPAAQVGFCFQCFKITECLCKAVHMANIDQFLGLVNVHDHS